MAIHEQKLHFVLLPFMAQGHTIPMVDIARLLAKRGVIVTILTTPLNHNRFKAVVERAIHSGLHIRVVELKFPSVEAGLPEGCENFDMIPSMDFALKFFAAIGHAAGSEISKDFENIASDTEYFVVPGLPDRIELTKAQLRGTINQMTSDWNDVRELMKESEREAFGVVANTFEELEPEYLKEYIKVKGKKVWCIGPVSLCNKEELDKAERDEFQAWLVEEKFVERIKGRGLLIHGWAPQVLILSHPAIGGFITHCGWNSTLEGICAGVPMITWPIFAEQFCNEKFIVNVLKTGLRVGVEIPVLFGYGEKTGVLVTNNDITTVIDRLMDGGEEGEERRERAKKLGKMAKIAPEEGGSSYQNMTLLIQDIMQQANL
ncbi:UDP-glycosyltransferase 73C1 [Abeliophyllum distichum]|uniref:UDP-glycosyltransferase 73C1 n=1 Tax=Abeliophyllum distichum TaxID=126358 RepID=A0ABD1RHC3_9LAMI